MKRRFFSKEFKREVVEELLSGTFSPGAICRKYSIAYQLLRQWQHDYSMGKLNNEPTTETGYKAKIEQLERMFGHLTMENDVLKKALQQAVSQRQKRSESSRIISESSGVSGGDVKC